MPGAAQLPEGGTEPSTPIADFLRALYGDVLGRSSVRPDDDFFADLNGNSLGAAEVIVTVERIFRVRVLEAFFADSTSSGVAREIERGLHDGGFDPARAGEAVPPGPVADALSRLLDSLRTTGTGTGPGPAPGRGPGPGGGAA